ncbi:MAG: ubiquinone/menaquinone biosynthesis methyltransferase [Deltaproteobacteria bacterium]|nr:ubiquinone/menaquinone biosynthesis methyltransferase [Deltaproteobacteria bacterium]
MVAPKAAAPLAATTNVRGMFDRIAFRYDAANRVMSAGVDKLWRRAAMAPLLKGTGANPCILDLGAGTLDGSLAIARRAPGARVASADFARQMLRVGQQKLGTQAARIGAHVADGHCLPYATAAFDGAFSAFCVRNLVHRDVAFAELRRVVKPGAAVVILEFFRPEKPRWFFDQLYNKYVLPWVGFAITGDKDAYQYLPESIAAFATRAQLQEELRAAGFASVSGKELFPGGVASLVVAR